MGRYTPTFALTSGSNILTKDVLLIEVKDAVTNSIPMGRFDINNRGNKWGSLAWNDPLLLTIDGVTKFRGRLDIPEDATGAGKKPGRILGFSARGNAGALQDIVSSIHVDNMTPAAIITTIMNEYNNRKLSGDPSLTIESNLAPNNPAVLVMNFLWKRKNLWSMKQDVADQLGAPIGLGGDGEFYDFYLSGNNGLIFEPIGYRNSNVTILESSETLKPTRIIDSLTVKNEILVWGDQGAGTLPLQMQLGYVGSGIRQDPWTENNASDYLPGDNVAGAGIQNDGTIKKFGSYSIKIPFSAIGGGQRGYWRMPFPFGAPYPPGGSKWPAQPPGDRFNTFNETSISETMGEITGIIFTIRNAVSLDFLLEVVDENDYLVQSTSTHLEGATIGNWFTPEWKTVQLPFGPSANYKSMDPLQIFNWAAVKEIRFVVYNTPSVMGFDVWFDGLAFIKPLVVRVTESGATTRRTQIKQANMITTYPQAKTFALALLENECKPQVYRAIENLGRVDIPIGSKFKIGTIELLMREATYKMTKSTGWVISGVAWEAT
jgi:hypothetical protein